MKESLANGIYTIAIVAEEEFVECIECPHCRSDKDPLNLEGDMNIGNHMGELMMCPDCANLFIIATYMTMYEMTEPIFMEITLDQESEPLKVVKPSDMVVQLMAAYGEYAVEPDEHPL